MGKRDAGEGSFFGKSFKRLLRFLPWVLLALIAAYFGIFGGWKDATFGRYHRKGHEMFSETNGITSVQVYLLAGEEADKTSEVFEVMSSNRPEPIYGNLELTGQELEEFLLLWESQIPGHRLQGLCHMPVYGYRLYRSGSLIRETSICWECSNYFVEIYPGVSEWYGFDSDSKSAQLLLEFCDERLPYKRYEGRASDD